MDSLQLTGTVFGAFFNTNLSYLFIHLAFLSLWIIISSQAEAGSEFSLLDHTIYGARHMSRSYEVIKVIGL